MIYIDLAGNPPPAELIAEGNALLEKLRKVDEKERAKFIDDNEDYWGKLKEHYSKLSHGKCWYTEAKEIASAYHMDHFRPKNKVYRLVKDRPIETMNSSEPYWWLAFDWENYRFAASIPNTKKRAYFPLRLGSSVATSKEELDKECVGLLDPTKKNDVALIGFGIDGKVCPACDDHNSWNAMRVKLSVRVYNLDYPPIVDERIKIQQRCKRKLWGLMNAVKAYSLSQSKENKEIVEDYLVDLREMIAPSTQLSAVARTFIRYYVTKDADSVLKKLLPLI